MRQEIIQMAGRAAGGTSCGLLAVLVVLLIGAAGCRQPQAPEYYGFQNMQLGKVGQVSLNGASTTLSATIKFYNPNPYSLRLKAAEMNVSLNGKHVGHSLLDSTIFIPKRDTFYVPVTLQVDLTGVLSNAVQLLLNPQATIALDGWVKIKKGALTFNRPFHYDGKEDLKSLLPQGTGF